MDATVSGRLYGGEIYVASIFLPYTAKKRLSRSNLPLDIDI
jgi:hypothetical protein